MESNPFDGNINNGRIMKGIENSNMTNGLYAVRIIRNEDQCVVSVCLKEFFKFCGIYVSEYILDNGMAQTDDEKVDLNLVLTEYKIEEKKLDAAVYYLMNCALIEDYDNFVKCFKSEAKKLFTQLQSDGLINIEQQKAFLRLVNIFLKHDYARNDYIKHSFASQLPQDELFDLTMSLCDCYSDLKKLNNEAIKSPYVLYAMLNCARKINDCCEIGKKLPVFDSKILRKKACEIQDLDKNYSMGIILSALCEMKNSSSSTETEDALAAAERISNRRKSAQFVQYTIGHYYEMDCRNAKQGWIYYQNILDNDPQNFRALFKCGCRQMRNEDYPNALVTFGKIINAMQKKKENGYIQPLELEYWYKSLLFCMRIDKICKNASGICDLMVEVKKVKEKYFEESKFSENFFEKKYQRLYAEYLMKKMERYQI